jgi:putative hydrolase of the HAD superfamily
MGPDIIFLDAGRTLLYPAEPIGETYAAAGRRHGAADDPAALESAFRDAFLSLRRGGRAQDRGWWREVVLRTFRPLGGGDLDALFDELYAHFSSPAAWRLYPDAIETVRTLRERGYRTGLISNWDDRLTGLLRGFGLLALLDPVVVSYRVGAEKPDPRIFRTALAEADVPPRRALMVGDDEEADVRGARAVGMAAVLIDHGGAEDGPHRVTSFGALLDRLPPREAAG